MGELMDGVVQQAMQCGRHCMVVRVLVRYKFSSCSRIFYADIRRFITRI